MTLIMNGTVSYVEKEELDDGVRMTRKASLITGYYLVTVVAVGLVVNVAVLNTFRRHPETLPASCRLLRFLCCCDTMMAILSLPFICASCIANRWLFADIGCQWYGFSMTAAALCTITTHSFVAFQRFNIIVRMRRESEHTIVTRARHMSVIIVIYGIVIGLLPFFGVGSYGFEPVFWSCTPTWWSTERNDFVFIIILFVCAFFLPVGVMVFSYVGISIKVFLRKTSKQTNRAHGVKMAIVFFLMIISFLLSWGPYAVVAFLQAFVRGFEVSPMVNTIPIMMAKSCILWDPLIYMGGNEKFRQALFSDVVNFAQIVKSKFSQLHGKTTSVVNGKTSGVFDRSDNNVTTIAASLAKERESKSNESCTPTSSSQLLVWENINTNDVNVPDNMASIRNRYEMIQIETTI